MHLRGAALTTHSSQCTTWALCHPTAAGGQPHADGAKVPFWWREPLQVAQTRLRDCSEPRASPGMTGAVIL